MDQNWKAVGAALRSSRLARGWTQETIAKKAGTSRSTIQNLEYSPARARIGPGLLAVVRTLGWPEGHIEKLLAGQAEGPPARPVADSEEDAGATSPDLPIAVAHELGQGSLIDSQVVDLGEDSGARMIVVVRGDQDMTPEQMKRALEEWKKVAKQMRMGESSPG